HPRRTSAHSLNRRNQFQHPHLLRGLVFIFGVILTLTACNMYGFYDDGIHYITGTEYDLYGYDKDGYNTAGFNVDGNHQDTGTKYGPDGYDEQGYNAEGFNAAGYDAAGYDKDGFNAAGYDAAGYDKDGFNAAGYDVAGYDKDGYDINGFNAAGIHRDTGTRYNPNGYDKDGYDANGFDTAGIHMETTTKYDLRDFKKDGYNDEGVYRDDFPTLAPENTNPRSIWSDGTTMWVLNNDNNKDTTDKIYAYNMETTVRDADEDFDLDSTIDDPRSIWSDGEIMWVLDEKTSTIYAYDMATKMPSMENENFSITIPSGGILLGGIWSDGETMWVAVGSAAIIYAYKMAKNERGTRDAAKDFDRDILDDENQIITGMWSDGSTMWLPDYGTDKIYAYTLDTRERDASKDFNNLVEGTIEPRGLYSDETTMWVLDFTTKSIYAYDMATRERPPKTE
ncbi:MAG: hypothetical protein ACR2PY_09505, partial [Salinispira sp.]